jgi:NodT family efflux transporter outer membrane factor (OMF) lipoprotein
MSNDKRATTLRVRMHFHKGNVTTLLCACAAAISGCAVGPDYQRPALPAASSYAPTPLPESTGSAPGAVGEAQRFVIAGQVQSDWWTLFQSPVLNALIAQAFAANPTLEAARASLVVAQENALAQRGLFYPTVQANYSPTRVRTADALASPAASGATYFTLHTAQLTVGFVPDVFGGNRRQVESLEAQAATQKLQLEAAYVTLASNIAAAAIQEALLREQIAISRRIVDAGEQTLSLARRQRQAGTASQLDVSLQETALAQAQQLLPPLQKQLDQTRHLLQALAGSTPDGAAPPPFELADFKLPETMPLSLPSQLLEQRPDVRAAEEQLHSASAQIGVATATRLPQFTIDATVGGAAITLARVFATPGQFFSVAGILTQSVFDGGTLQHRQRAAEAGYAQAAAQYRSTVLAAFQNVADSLQALYTDADNLRASVAAAQSSAQTLALVRRQLAGGYIDRLALLAASQAHDQALLAVASARAVRLGETVSLFQALGGGWWSRASGSAPGSTWHGQ